jgi:hypothetical protein
VCHLQLAVGVEADGGGQGSWLLPGEDSPRIQDGPAFQGERHPAAFELAAEDRQVEFGQIEPSQVGRFKEVGQRPGVGKKPRLAADVEIGDAVDRCRRRWDRLPGVDAGLVHAGFAARLQLERGEFDDACVAGAQAGGFEVEHDQRSALPQVGEHGIHNWISGEISDGCNQRARSERAVTGRK